MFRDLHCACRHLLGHNAGMIPLAHERQSFGSSVAFSLRCTAAPGTPFGVRPSQEMLLGHRDGDVS